MEGFKCYGPKDDRYIIRLGTVDKIHLEEALRALLHDLESLEKEYPRLKNDSGHMEVKALYTSQLHALRNPEKV